MEPALLPSPGRPVRFFDPYGAATGRLELGQPCLIGTTTERATLFGPFRLLRRNSACRKGCPLMVRSVAQRRVSNHEA